MDPVLSFTPRKVVDVGKLCAHSGELAAIEITQNKVRKTAKPEGITQNSTATTESFPVPPRGRTGCMVRAPLVRPVSETPLHSPTPAASLESIRPLLSRELTAWSEPFSFNPRPSPAAYLEPVRPLRVKSVAPSVRPPVQPCCGVRTLLSNFPLHGLVTSGVCRVPFPLHGCPTRTRGMVTVQLPCNARLTAFIVTHFYAFFTQSHIESIWLIPIASNMYLVRLLYKTSECVYIK